MPRTAKYEKLIKAQEKKEIQQEKKEKEISEILVSPSNISESSEFQKMYYIESIIEERGKHYGEFYNHARIAQNLKNVMQDTPNWEWLNPPMKEALEMVAHKIGRILNGDPNYKDSWTDIIGYIRLVEKDLK